MTPEVLNYYSYQISGDFMLMDDQVLFQGINNLNQPSLDPMDVLISGLTMKYSKTYDKNLVQQYISSFITLLGNYPFIKAKCKPEAIVKQFYKKIATKQFISRYAEFGDKRCGRGYSNPPLKIKDQRYSTF